MFVTLKANTNLFISKLYSPFGSNVERNEYILHLFSLEIKYQHFNILEAIYMADRSKILFVGSHVKLH